MSEQPRKKRPASFSRRLTDVFWAWSWRLVALGLILAAVLLTVARLLLPFASEYRAELEQRVESYLGTEVTIGALDIGWHAFVPRVELTNVTVQALGPVREAIAFERAYITVLPGWKDGRPTLRIADVSLLGLELSARVDDAGRIHALGTVLDPGTLAAGAASGDGARAGAAPALAGLFAVSRVQLLDTTLAIVGPRGRVTRWRDIELRLANADRRHRLSLVFAPPEEWGRQVRALLEFEGEPDDYGNWAGQLFVEVEGLVLDAWSPLWPDAPVRTPGGRIDATLWGDWQGDRLIEARLELTLADLVLAAADHDADVRFERIAANVRLWRPAASLWQADVGGLQVSRDGREWGDTGLSFAREDSGGWRLATRFARLDDVAAVARVLPLPGDARERLATLAPGGEVRDLHLAVGADGAFRVRGDFRDLGWSARGKVPGMSGLDGRAELGSAGGHVTVASSGVQFDAPELFRAPLRLDELGARVQVVPTDAGFVLDAPRVQLHNTDLAGRGRLRVELPRGEPPRIDLQFAYRDGIASATPRYLPARIMPEPVVSWLDQAFHGGRVEQGSFIFRGRATDFPFRGHEGVFDVRAEVADVTLHYAPGWPSIEGLRGRVHFAGPGLSIRADEGSSRGVRLRQGVARIPDLREGQLAVDVDARGPVDGMIGVLNDSPLADLFEPVFGAARGRGEATLALDLAIPVKEVRATRASGTVTFADAGLVQPDYDLAFSQLAGRVRFTERSVDADGVTGVLRGQPVRMDAATRGGIGYFRFTGDFALSELVPALAAGPLAGSEGRSAWDIVLRAPFEAAGVAELEAKSDLRGTRIDLPAPLAKAGPRARPVRLEMPLGGGHAGTARLRYGNNVRVALEFDEGRELTVRRLGVGLDRPASLPRTPGIRVAGQLEALALAPWLDGPGGNGALELVELDLRVRLLGYRRHRLSEVVLDGGRTPTGGWRLGLTSNEATGSIAWPPSGERRGVVRARFDWIDLALLTGHQAEAGDDYGDLADPQSLPPLDLQVERLKLADATIEQFVLVTGTGGAGRNIHRLDFHTQHLRVRGQGLWRGTDRPGTQLRLTMRSQDFGQGLAEFGYPDTMANGEGQVTFDLEWPAAPWQPTLGSLEGHVNVEIDEGVLLQVNPGAARLLGMFSLEAIPFRTLLQKGLIFQEMRGRIDLAGGNAYMNGFKIDSAIGLIKVSGRTGLVAQDYDQRVVVHPELSSSLPVIGFLSGGPIAGAAIALLQGVLRNLGQDVERASRVEYRVTGPWDKPRVERVGAPEAESGSETIRETPR